MGTPNYNYEFTEDGFIRMMKDLNYGLRHLDSQNVERLFTNQTEIQDEGGLTRIAGPLMQMYDTDNNLRLLAGYDTDDNEFKFSLYDQSGNATIELNDTGEAWVYTVHTSEDVYVGRRIFIDWDSTHLCTDLSTTFNYGAGTFFMTASTDFISTAKHYIGQIVTTARSPSTLLPLAVWPDDFILEMQSSAQMEFTAYSKLRAQAYGELYATSDIAAANGKSTDYLSMQALTGLMLLNTTAYEDALDSTALDGTFIGHNRNNYIDYKASSNRIAVEGTQKIYNSKTDIIQMYSRNMRQYDEGLHDAWVTETTNGAVYQTIYYRTMNYSRSALRNYTTVGGNWIQAILTTNEGLVPFDGLSFNDGTAVSTDNDYFVWAFYLTSTAYLYDANYPDIHVGNSSDDVYVFHAQDVITIQEGFNVAKFKFTQKYTIQGTPNLNAINWIRFSYRQLDQPQYATVLSNIFIGVVRGSTQAASTGTGTIMQRYDPYNLEWNLFGESTSYDEMVFLDTNNNLQLGMLKPSNTANALTLNTIHRDHFQAKIKYTVNSTSEGSPVVGQYFDANNYWYARVANNYLQAFIIHNSSVYDSISKAFTVASSHYDDATLYVDRTPDGYLDIHFENNSTNFRTSIESFIPSSWYNKAAPIELGNESTSYQTWTIQELEVKPYGK